ncbi:MAG: nuclear transport factor 2 family protein [Sphingomonas sp.]
MTLSIEDRIRRLEDIEEVRQLVTDYAALLDARDMEAYADLFARDGAWIGPVVGAAHGREAILALMRANLDPAPPGANHLVSNIVVAIDGDAGTARSRWTYVVPDAQGGPSLAISGRYDDRVVREDGRWRFAARTVSGDLPAIG